LKIDEQRLMSFVFVWRFVEIGCIKFNGKEAENFPDQLMDSICLFDVPLFHFEAMWFQPQSPIVKIFQFRY